MMSYMSELSLDIEQREGRQDWAILLDDETRPATLWRVIGETKGKTILRHSRLPIDTVQLTSNVWVIA